MEWKTADLVETDWDQTVKTLAMHMAAADRLPVIWGDLGGPIQERYMAMARTFLGYLKTSPFRLMERGGGESDGR